MAKTVDLKAGEYLPFHCPDCDATFSEPRCNYQQVRQITCHFCGTTMDSDDKRWGEWVIAHYHN